MSHTTGTIAGTLSLPDGSPLTGQVEVIPSASNIVDATGDVIFLGRAKAPIVDGSFAVTVPASDDEGLNPSGVTYVVVVKGHNAPGFTVKGVFVSSGQTVQLADVVDPDPTAPGYALQVTRVEFDELAALVAAGGGGGGGGTGPQGPAGPQGPQGIKGDTGAAGPAGSAGPTGPAGPKGDTGDAGPVGATGPQGVKGDTGTAGATGAAGATGPQGVAGPIGATGPKGDTGAASTVPGPAGPIGPQGPAGSDATVPDAASSIKGRVQLAGDLGGTAAAPTVPALATKVTTTAVRPTVRLGVFPESANPTSEAEYVAASGEPVTAMLVPYNYTQQPNTTTLNALNARGVEPVIGWMPCDNTEAAASPTYSLANIIAGNFDAYMTTFLTTVKNLGYPVTIRWAHEMNGDWYPWAEKVNGNSAGQYATAWQRVVNLARTLGATNIKWMWTPNAAFPGSTALAGLYPGSSYVDLVGVNGYNYGTGGPDGLRTPSQVFDATLDEIATFGRGKPIWLGETGTKDTAGDKAAWITSFFSWLSSRGIAGFIWFNSSNVAEGYDWRVNSSTAAANAWTAGMTSLRTVAKASGKAVAQADGPNVFTGRQNFYGADVVGLPVVLPTVDQIGAAPANPTINFFTADLTLPIWVAGRQLLFDGTAAQTITVPPNSSAAFPLGTTIDVAQNNTGAVTFAAGAGVTVSSRGALLKIAGRYGVASLRKTGTNAWLLFGDLSA